MAGENLIEIVVTLRNQASQQLSAVSSSLKQLGPAGESASQALRRAGESTDVVAKASAGFGGQLQFVRRGVLGAARDVSEWSLLLGQDLSPAVSAVTGNVVRLTANILELGTKIGLITGIIGLAATALAFFASRGGEAEKVTRDLTATVALLQKETNTLQLAAFRGGLLPVLSEAEVALLKQRDAIDAARAAAEEWNKSLIGGLAGLIGLQKGTADYDNQLDRLRLLLDIIPSQQAALRTQISLQTQQLNINKDVMGESVDVLQEWLISLERGTQAVERATRTKVQESFLLDRDVMGESVEVLEEWLRSLDTANRQMLERFRAATRERLLIEQSGRRGIIDEELATGQEIDAIVKAGNESRRQAWEDNNRLLLESTEAMTQQVSQSLGQALGDFATGDLQNFGDLWTGFWKNMVRIAADSVAQSLLFGGGGAPGMGQAAGGGLFGLLGSLFGTSGGGLADLGLATLQHGGVVSKPTLSLVGEAGPEAVVPLDEVGALGGGTTVINVFKEEDLTAIVARETAKNRRVVVNDVMASMRGNGPMRRAVQRG